MADSTAEVRQEIAATRAQMSETIAEIDARVSEGVSRVKEKFDVMEWARQNPWPALAVAFGLGLGLSASGADGRAARATTRAVKSAPRAAKGAAKRWRERRREAAAEKAAYEADEAPPQPGAFGRLKQGIGDHVRTGAGQIVEQMREAAAEIGDQATPPAVHTEALRNGAWTNS